MSNASGNGALLGDGALLLDCILLFPSGSHAPDIGGLSLWVETEMMPVRWFLLFLLVSMQPDEKPKLEVQTRGQAPLPCSNW